jgi:hypothetical protein
MKPALIASVTVLAVCALVAQASSPGPTPGLNLVLDRIQQTAHVTDDDVGRLHIDRWKVDFDQKVEMQKIAESVHRNLTLAIPDLIKQMQSGKSSVSSAFQLYHNVNVLYEYINLLAESADHLGRPEEYIPLSRDASALDGIRQDLSAYIQQSVAALEIKAATPVPTPVPCPPPPKKIVIDEFPVKPVTPRKKKTSTPKEQPSPSPSPSPSPTPKPSASPAAKASP